MIIVSLNKKISRLVVIDAKPAFILMMPANVSPVKH